MSNGQCLKYSANTVYIESAGNALLNEGIALNLF